MRALSIIYFSKSVLDHAKSDDILRNYGEVVYSGTRRLEKELYANIHVIILSSGNIDIPEQRLNQELAAKMKEKGTDISNSTVLEVPKEANAIEFGTDSFMKSI